MRVLSYNNMRGYSPSPDITQAAHVLMKKFRHYYTVAPANARRFFNSQPVKSSLYPAGRQVRDLAHNLSGYLRSAKSYLILGSAGYALYASYRYCNKVHPVETVNRRIREKPLKSALVALGIGLILGKLF